MFCFKTHFAPAAALLFLSALLTGCGKSNQSTDSVGGGAQSLRKSNYKAQDAQLVQGSNNIPVYSTPDNARRALRRSPDQTVNEGNGTVTQYYNSDQSNANSERLRLRYADNRLIGKEIVPADGTASTAQTPNSGKVNVQGLETNNAPARSSYGTSNYYNPTATGTAARKGTPTERANAASNDDFNTRLNTQQQRY